MERHLGLSWDAFLLNHKIMRIIHKFFIGCIIICSIIMASCSNCSGNKDRADSQDSVPTFSKADTTEVLKMAENYLTHLKNKEYDAALHMLYYVENDSVKPLPDDEKQKIIEQQNVFPVLDFKLESYKFVNEFNVEATYSIEFFKKPDPDDPIQNTIRITFAPVKYDGAWYLALLSKSYMSKLN